MKALKIITLLFCISLMSSAGATDRRGRLGAGFSNQLKVNDLPALSFKLQRSKSFAFGGLIGLSTNDADGGFGAAFKIYRNLFEEPQLNFYTSLLAGVIKEKTGGAENSGFQVDLTLGSEFHFAGLASLGFSVEFGISANKKKDFVLETVGNSFVVAGAHFYL